MAITIPAASRQAIADALVDLTDAGTGAGTIQIRTGSAPDPDSAPTGTLLATLTCSGTAFGSASDDGTTATATAASITDDSSADATGTAAHFRLLDSDGNLILQGTAGDGGSEDLVLNNASITSGGTVSITSFTVTVGQAQS